MQDNYSACAKTAAELSIAVVLLRYILSAGLHIYTADIMFANICCCSADGKDRRHGPTTNSRQMTGALKPGIVGLARCAHGLTCVPMHIVADLCIAAAESVLASISKLVCHNMDRLKLAPPHQASALDGVQ